MAKSERRDDVIYFDDPSLTQQSAKDECDINLIVENAKRGADISNSLNKKAPMYGDFTGLPSFKDALNVVVKANEMFMSMDAFVRERFGNDPGRLLEFLDNPDNREEAIKLGLLQPPPVANPPLPVVALDAVSPVKAKAKAKPDVVD